MRRTFSFLLVVIALFSCLHLKAQEFNSDQKLRLTHALIEAYYVEEVNSDTIVTEAIKAMLKTLDPHSSYTDAAETKELTEPLDGKFSGIGIQFNMLEDTVYVVQTIVGGPCEKVGILPGDRIISANDTIIAGLKMKNNQIMKVLRGPKGSKVILKVKRGNDIMDFKVVRDDIPIYSVDEIFMADATTGYIRITRFAEDTGKEVAEALKKLTKQGAKNIILDVSDNGGGYLGAAFEVASLFLPKGTPVVSTSGRSTLSQDFTTDKEGVFKDGRVVVIANQYSASASEILAGALQDNDRGVIVGRRTFGKGLVQRPFPFPDGSMIRLTTSRYYTPSGRCIQKPYTKGHTDEYQLEVYNRYDAGELWSADSISKPDSLKYYTLHSKRPVYGGGGIIPDIFVPVDTSYFSPLYRNIVAKGILNSTTMKFIDRERNSIKSSYPTPKTFGNGFKVPQTLIAELRAAAEASDIEWNDDEFSRSQPYIEAIMRGLIQRDIYDDGSYYSSLAPLNNSYVTALEVINDKKRYESLLASPND